MKFFVNIMQLLIIAALIYPFFYLWETDKIETLCDELEVGMSAEEIISKADQFFLKWQKNQQPEAGKWQLQLISRASFAGFICDIKGKGKKMSSARVMKGADIP